MSLSKENIESMLYSGKVKSYQLEKIILDNIFESDSSKWDDSCNLASQLRLEFLEKSLNSKFNLIRKSYMQVSNDKDGNLTTGIEQLIGGAVTPLGISTPLKINGQYAQGDFYIPIATNEAALIAGLNRGIKCINQSGGVNCLIKNDCMTRAPALLTPSIFHAKQLVDEINKKGELYTKLKVAAESESRVSKLLSIQPYQLGRKVWLRFEFFTGDSMGMNSATKYAANAIQKLKEIFPWVTLIALSGNLCTDKKSAHINVLNGRGKSVETEVIIPKEALRETFSGADGKLSPENVERVNFIKNYQGSALSGTFAGFNANAANTIAGIFAACGQDLAQVVGSSSAFCHAETTENGDLYFGVTLPSLEVGSVGGGIDRGTALECMKILGCEGKGQEPGTNAKKFAETIAAAVTAQELNLLCTLASQYELAESHIRLARGKHTV